jgi:ectoine hydroxylase-related dioxygenase (phytanoyl-CoA dioxygenase family)
MLRDPTDGSDPLPNDGQAWILQNEQLLGILHQLHSDEGSSNENAASKDKEADPSWQWLHPTNIGWIHVRLPVSNASQFEHRWHVDGGHFSPHFLTSPEQSVVVLPMLHDVGVGGGNTVVLPGSHHYMAQLLHQNRDAGLLKSVTQDCRKLGEAWPIQKEIAPCHGGDVLIMHPLLVHAAGFHTNGTTTERISFNLGTKWTRQLLLKEPNSWLESSLKRSLSETTGLPKLSVEALFKLKS